MDFVEICKVFTRKVIIKAAKRTYNSDKVCRSYRDFYFGVIFWNTLYFELHNVCIGLMFYSLLSTRKIGWGYVRLTGCNGQNRETNIIMLVVVELGSFKI